METMNRQRKGACSQVPQIYPHYRTNNLLPYNEAQVWVILFAITRDEPHIHTPTAHTIHAAEPARARSATTSPSHQ